MADSSNGTPRVCTKCGERPANQKHDWCSQCKLEYATKNAEARDEMMARRGYVAGAEAMRSEFLSRMRSAHPAGLLRVAEVCNFLAKVPAPRMV